MSGEKKRKIIIINKKFQFRMISKFLILNIILMILFGGLIYLFMNSEIDSNLQSAHATYKNVKEMLFPIVVYLSIINILFSSIIISVFVLYASFKIAGPLYRFNEALHQMCNKNLSPVTTIRTDDQLYECSSTLTALSEIMSKDMGIIKRDIDEIKKLIQKGATRKSITEKIRELEEILDLYKI